MSESITAVSLPEGFDESAVLAELRQKVLFAVCEVLNEGTGADVTAVVQNYKTLTGASLDLQRLATEASWQVVDK